MLARSVLLHLASSKKMESFVRRNRWSSRLARRFVAGETIEELLWGAWQRSGLEKTWFEQALGSGLVAEEANRHLDAVVALFSAAKRFVERTPDVPAAVFLDSWRSADVAEDTLAPRATIDSVTVGTPSAM